MTEDPTGGKSPAPTDLAAAIEALASTLEGVERRQVGEAVEFLRAKKPFALLEGSSLVVHLRPELADAAVLTPDASQSGRGSGWVSLRPKTADEFALDRARAWFESAFRLASEG